MIKYGVFAGNVMMMVKVVNMEKDVSCVLTVMFILVLKYMVLPLDFNIIGHC